MRQTLGAPFLGLSLVLAALFALGIGLREIVALARIEFNGTDARAKITDAHVSSYRNRKGQEVTERRLTLAWTLKDGRPWSQQVGVSSAKWAALLTSAPKVDAGDTAAQKMRGKEVPVRYLEHGPGVRVVLTDDDTGWPPAVCLTLIAVFGLGVGIHILLPVLFSTLGPILRRSKQT